MSIDEFVVFIFLLEKEEELNKEEDYVFFNLLVKNNNLDEGEAMKFSVSEEYTEKMKALRKGEITWRDLFYNSRQSS